MPFTGSHPAAVLPLLGLGMPASALVIGSMAPDFPYYFPFATASWPTHTGYGIVTIDVLLGLAVWALWHGVLSAPALYYAPLGARQRLEGVVESGFTLRIRNRRLMLLTVLALIVGSATHVLWDEFSHPGRWGTHHLHVLTVRWAGLPGYRWVQYGSGVFGASVEAYWLWRWWRRTPATATVAPRRNGWNWLGLVLIGGVVGGWAAATSPSLQTAAFNGATRGGGAMVAAALVLAVAWHLRRSAVRGGSA
jgi:Domain of unknown function (DUF4184)